MSIGLNDYEWSFRGLVFGGIDGSLPVGVRMIDGLQDFDVRSGDSAVPRGDGSIPGLHLVKSKDIKLELLVNGEPKSDAIEAAMASVRSVFQRSQTANPLFFKLPGQDESFVYVRCVGRQEKKDLSSAFGQRPVLVRLIAADPRIYGSESRTSTLAIYDGTGGGLDYGVTDYGKEYTVDSSTEAVVTNDGDANAYPLLRFYGPTDAGTLTAVKITNISTGGEFEAVTNILTGQSLDCYMRRIITADPDGLPYIGIGSASRYGDWTLPRIPFYLAPGDNLLRFEPTGTTLDAPCVVTYNDTWL